MKLPVVAHIGMHKTGSTFLQQRLFPSVSGALFSKRRNLRDYYHHNRGEAIIISDEILSGDPFSGTTIADFKWKMSVLQSLCPDAIILVCFREPVSYIVSLYKQYLHQGGTDTFDQFFNLEGSGVMGPESLNYVLRLQILKQSFDSVIAYDYDVFRRDATLIYQEIAAAIGVPVSAEIPQQRSSNVSIKQAWQVELLRRANALFGFTYHNKFCRRLGLTPRNLIQNKLSMFGGARWDIRPEVKDEISSYFREEWTTTKCQILS